MHVIRVQDVSQKFKKGTQVNTILEHINVSFQQHKTYALMGVSGSGKTTLLSLLAGIRTPTSGTIFFDQHNIAQLDQSSYLNKKIGIVFQQPYLIDELTVLENIMLKGLIAGEAYASAQNQAFDLLVQLNLGNKADSLPKELSGGEQQRVAIGRAIFAQPMFLLADEPTAHLDPTNKKQLLSLFKYIQQTTDIGLIIATHDQEVSKWCDHVWYIANGAIKPAI